MLGSMISGVIIPTWCRCLYSTADQHCCDFRSWFCWTLVVDCFSLLNRYHRNPEYGAMALCEQRISNAK